jgi:hypothetical protein
MKKHIYRSNDNANCKLFCIDASPSEPFAAAVWMALICILGFPGKLKRFLTIIIVDK